MHRVMRSKLTVTPSLEILNSEVSDNYYQLVNEAKILMAKNDLLKLRLAKLAIKACSIRHGGRSDGHYTLANFASDVGVSRKQLSNWVLTFNNVVQQIEELIKTNDDWVTAQRIQALIAKENTYLRKGDDNLKSKKIYYRPTRDDLIALMAKVRNQEGHPLLKAEEFIKRGHFHLGTVKSITQTDLRRRDNVKYEIEQIIKTCNEMLELVKQIEEE